MLFKTAMAAAIALCATVGAQAATVTYTNAATSPKAQLTIDDTAAGVGKFRFTLTTLVGAADFLGLGFNLAGSSNPLKSLSFTLVSATNAANASIKPVLELFGKDDGKTSKCGPGCNFEGKGSASAFDYILRIGQNGSGGNNYVKSLVFDVTYSGSLKNNPFSQLAFRAQSTSNAPNNSGSIKADLNQVSAVPLPAGGLLLLGGLGALVGFRRKRKLA